MITKYKQATSRGHPRAPLSNIVYEHILIAEKVLGRYLKFKEKVHHIDGNGLNNANNNLVICENQAYHKLLHNRAKALKECGHANWRKCKYCKQYDDPKNLITTAFMSCHRLCYNEYNLEQYHKKQYAKRRNQ